MIYDISVYTAQNIFLSSLYFYFWENQPTICSGFIVKRVHCSNRKHNYPYNCLSSLATALFIANQVQYLDPKAQQHMKQLPDNALCACILKNTASFPLFRLLFNILVWNSASVCTFPCWVHRKAPIGAGKFTVARQGLPKCVRKKQLTSVPSALTSISWRALSKLVE